VRQSVRPRWAPVRALLIVGCMLGVLLPAVGAQAQSATREDLAEVQSRLEDARAGLADVEGRQAVTLGDLERSDARRIELEAQLVAREAELASAEAALVQAEQTLDATTQLLTVTRDRLIRTRARLAERIEEFKARARASYMYGGTADAPSALLEVRDVSEFSRALTYVTTVLSGDRRVVENVEELEAQVDADADALAELQDRQREERAAAETQRNAVAVLVDEQRRLKAEAEAEVERHRQILAQLEADEQAHQDLIAALDADSARLTAELQAAEAARAEREAAREAAGRRAPAAPPPSGSGAFQRPSGGGVTSGFGYRVHPIFGTSRLHTGTDFGGAAGSPIYAADSGVVVSAGTRGGYGNATVIDHGGGVATLYAHQSRLGVAAGQHVSRGEVIGAVGSTGYSTGPHLHFEVRVNGTPVDPMGYL